MRLFLFAAQGPGIVHGEQIAALETRMGDVHRCSVGGQTERTWENKIMHVCYKRLCSLSRARGRVSGHASPQQLRQMSQIFYKIKIVGSTLFI